MLLLRLPIKSLLQSGYYTAVLVPSFLLYTFLLSTLPFFSFFNKHPFLKIFFRSNNSISVLDTSQTERNLYFQQFLQHGTT
jgi:hypothetical protein